VLARPVKVKPVDGERILKPSRGGQQAHLVAARRDRHGLRPRHDSLVEGRGRDREGRGHLPAVREADADGQPVSDHAKR
jgi:hypothetical protein